MVLPRRKDNHLTSNDVKVMSSGLLHDFCSTWVRLGVNGSKWEAFDSTISKTEGVVTIDQEGLSQTTFVGRERERKYYHKISSRLARRQPFVRHRRSDENVALAPYEFPVGTSDVLDGTND